MSENKEIVPGNKPNPDPNYWRSFSELYNDPDYV